MADPAEAGHATGFVIGGISPLGQKRQLPIVADESASQWPTVFVRGAGAASSSSAPPRTWWP
jgi:Cys-tRNA(Pro)/Cys-tRNA(Cys) deacylase